MILTAGGIFALWQASRVGAKMIQDAYEIPDLAEGKNTSLLSLRQRFMNFITGVIPPPAKLSDAVFEPVLQARINSLSGSLKNSVTNGGVLPNILLWGPPGTGKTLAAQLMARTSGMEFSIFKASDLEAFSIEVGMQKLKKLFEYKYENKIMIVIDEAESILGQRSNPNLSDKAKKFLTAFLGYTGTESTQFSVVIMTNRPQDLDEAVTSRCDYKIQVDVPGYDQVLAMIKLYVNKYLIEASDKQPEKVSLWTRAKNFVFGGAKEIVKPKIEEGALSDEILEALATRLVQEGFVGRDISKLIVQIRNTSDTRIPALITKDLIFEVMETYIAQEIAGKQGFKRKAA